MTRAKDISKIVTDADLSGTLDVTGTVTAGGLSVDNGAVSKLDVYSNGFNTVLQETGSGSLYISGDDLLFIDSALSKPHAKMASNGDISFYEDTGTTPKLFWDASAEALGLGTSSPTKTLDIDGQLRIRNGGTTGYALLEYGASSTATNNWHVGSEGDGSFRFYNGVFGSGSERMRIDSSGNVGIGTNSPISALDLSGGADGTPQTITLAQGNASSKASSIVGTYSSTNEQGINFVTNNFGQSTAMSLTASGNVLVGTTTSLSSSVTGIILKAQGDIEAYRSSNRAAIFGRNTNDGTIVAFAQADIAEGSISVSGTTVSYNGGHLARWSRLLDNSKDTSIVKGTVMTNLDEMVEWDDEDNEQLNKMAVSSVEGDANVAGVFVNWDNDDDYNDMNIAMTGDMVIRIAQGTTIARGDLLMSAGDGTAKPQGDDIVRSKTIAKVTSTNVSHTYDDGTYVVPCVLMAC
jgi:hypothetical protein